MKRTSQLLLSCLLAATAALSAQSAPPVEMSQAIFPVYSINIAPATQANTAIVGSSGNTTIYYWMVSNFLLGSSTPIGPFIVNTANSTLSSGNYVAFTPVYPGGGIISIDLLKTSTPNAPSGACNCAVHTGSTSGNINDQSNSTSSYTVSPISISTFNITLQNEVQGAGSTHLIMRQNGAFVIDLSTGSVSSGTVTSVATGTGLTGGPITTSGTLSIATAYQLPQGCTVNQVPVSTGANVWNCGNQSGGSFTPGGNLSGSSSSQNVIGLTFNATSINLSNTPPTSGQCLEYNGTTIGGTTCGSGGLPSATQGQGYSNSSGGTTGAGTNGFGIDATPYLTGFYTTGSTVPTVDATAAFNTMLAAVCPTASAGGGCKINLPPNSHVLLKPSTAGTQIAVPLNNYNSLHIGCQAGNGSIYSASRTQQGCTIEVGTAGAYAFGCGQFGTTQTAGPTLENVVFVDDTTNKNAAGGLFAVDCNNPAVKGGGAFGGFRQTALAAPSAPACTQSNSGGSLTGAVHVELQAWTNSGPTLVSAATACTGTTPAGTGSVSITIPAATPPVIGYEAQCAFNGSTTAYTSCSALPTYTSNSDGSTNLVLPASATVSVTAAISPVRTPQAINHSQSEVLVGYGSDGWGSALGFTDNFTISKWSCYLCVTAVTAGLNSAMQTLHDVEVSSCDASASTGGCVSSGGVATPGTIIGIAGLRSYNTHATSFPANPSSGTIFNLTGFNNVIQGGTIQGVTGGAETGVTFTGATRTKINGLIVANYANCFVADVNSKSNAVDFGDNTTCGTLITDNDTTNSNTWMRAGGSLLIGDTIGSVWGGATGGAQGTGTINAKGLYVNGVAVGSGTFSPVITSPANTQNLSYNGTNWVNGYSGVNVDPQTGDYTLGCPTDRLGEVDINITSAHGLYLPQAGSTACLGSNMAFVVRNTASSTAVLTVCAGTGTNGSCTGGSSTFQPENVASHTVLPGGGLFVYSDATTSTGNYHALDAPASFGGVNVQTTAYTLTAADRNKMVIMNCSAACAATMPATPPNSAWTAWILSIGSTKATVSLNSLNFNGGASAPVLISDMPLMFRTDGTNYFGDAPLVAGTNITLTAASNGVTIAATGGGGSAWSGITAGANTATGPFSTTAPWTFSAAGAASTPGLSITGAPFTGGSATTNFPQFYLNSGASAPTTFSTAGTVFGINAPSGFTGNFIDFYVNGSEDLKISTSGNISNPNGAVSLTAASAFGVNLNGGGNATLQFLNPGGSGSAASLVINGWSAGSSFNDIIATFLKATASLTAGQVVKLDTSNAESVVVATTTDTGAGIALSFVGNSPSAAANAQIVLPGSAIYTPLLGTGTCTLGQFVIVDTTTNGRVKCTGTFAAGTVLGRVIVAQASVGSAVGVYVWPQ